MFFKLFNVYITLSHYEVNIRYLMVKFSRLNQRQPHIQASDINIKNGGWYIEQIKMQREKSGHSSEKEGKRGEGFTGQLSERGCRWV